MAKRKNSQKELKTELKLQVKQQVPMSAEGLRHWNKSARARIRKKVFKHALSIVAPVEEISSKVKAAEFFKQFLWEGTFYVFGRSHGKNKYHNKPTCLFIVYVTETTEGNSAIVKPYRKAGRPTITRYWFYNNK